VHEADDLRVLEIWRWLSFGHIKLSSDSQESGNAVRSWSTIIGEGAASLNILPRNAIGVYLTAGKIRILAGVATLIELARSYGTPAPLR
jgi:hypothetical protein